jgi:hypothetical protein
VKLILCLQALGSAKARPFNVYAHKQPLNLSQESRDFISSMFSVTYTCEHKWDLPTASRWGATVAAIDDDDYTISAECTGSVLVS